MKYMQKHTIFLVGVFIITLSIFPMFAAASHPPEWVNASGDNVTVGYTTSGDYRNTYSQDFSYHEIKCTSGGLWGSWHGRVFYSFAGKCSKVKLWVDLDPLLLTGNCFFARAYYTDGTWEDLGRLNPQKHYEFDLNAGKYLSSIMIDYYLKFSLIPYDRYMKIDYISCYWTGHP